MNTFDTSANIPMSAFTLMESSAVLVVFLPVRLDVARTSCPNMTTASSWVNTDILVLDNLSNALFGMVIPSQKPMAHVAMLSDTGFHWHVPLTFSRHTDMTPE